MQDTKLDELRGDSEFENIVNRIRHNATAARMAESVSAG